MNKVSVLAIALAGCSVAACSEGMGTRYGATNTAPAPARQTYSSGASGPQYSTSTDNSMPGKQGGFNNDDINGKSRNLNTTTPGTGPMNANPVASGNTPR